MSCVKNVISTRLKSIVFSRKRHSLNDILGLVYTNVCGPIGVDSTMVTDTLYFCA